MIYVHQKKESYGLSFFILVSVMLQTLITYTLMNGMT